MTDANARNVSRSIITMTDANARNASRSIIIMTDVNARNASQSIIIMTDANVRNASQSIIIMTDANVRNASRSTIIMTDVNARNASRIITTMNAIHADPIHAATATPTRAAASLGSYGATVILICGSSRTRKSRISITRPATVKPYPVRSGHSQPSVRRRAYFNITG
ncbi:hypothetical protein [Paenibacillus thiaminolyticus]|uniref:hypothetical protein n=1 Tax=Paenibacillus thiaminolyticus TaxID=49283 RepID=UPI0011C3F73C|nr:hypothetical protein [Paenibacillus thiaminolyticus]